MKIKLIKLRFRLMLSNIRWTIFSWRFKRSLKRVGKIASKQIADAIRDSLPTEDEIKEVVDEIYKENK